MPYLMGLARGVGQMQIYLQSGGVPNHSAACPICAGGVSTHQQFERDFVASADSPVVGVFIQITDVHGKILYQSDVLSGTPGTGLAYRHR